ncbi:MAG: bifunctional demethylmenaquinone methyltransferase/2-methoxy-6-polyprenyl-1,4-benzoquinol methylase UbiE [Oligoflexales bacterium]
MVKPQSEQVIAGMFDKIAPRYDMLNLILSAGQDRRWRRHLIRNIPKNARLLDVATGTADVLIAASNQTSHLQGVDISKGMLALGERKLKKHNIVADLQTMSAEALAFAPHSFDCVTISFGLRNVVDQKKAIREFHRVLTSSGRLLILEFFLPKSGMLSRFFQFYFHQILPRIGGALSDSSAYRYLPKSVEDFNSADALELKLREAGFQSVEQVSFLFGACRLVIANR